MSHFVWDHVGMQTALLFRAASSLAGGSEAVGERWRLRAQRHAAAKEERCRRDASVLVRDAWTQFTEQGEVLLAGSV